jgi:hypothetical protein
VLPKTYPDQDPYRARYDGNGFDNFREGVAVKNLDWNRDMIGEIEGVLNVAQQLWNKQIFVKPTEERRKEIFELLREASNSLEDIIAELEE